MCRRVLVWSSALLVVLVVLTGGSLLYLRTVGLPDALKARVEAALRARGLSVQLGRVWWQGSAMLRAEDVRIRSLQVADGPQLSIGQASLKLTPAALRQFRLQPESLTLDQGRLIWSLATSNTPARELAVDEIGAQLDFPARDRLEIARCNGRFLGTELRVEGSLTNVSDFAHWQWRTNQHRTDWKGRLSELLARSDRLQITPPSVLMVRVQGDGRDPGSLHIAGQLSTPKAVWPDGRFDNLQLTLRLAPSLASTSLATISLDCHFDQAEGKFGQWHDASLAAQWLGSITNQATEKLDWKLRVAGFELPTATGQSLAISGATVHAEDGLIPYRTELRLEAAAVQTPWAHADTNRLEVLLSHGPSLSAPWDARWQLGFGPIRSRWGQASRTGLSGRVTPRAGWVAPRGPDWLREVRDGLDAVELDWQCEVQQVVSPKLVVDLASCAGDWRAPNISLANVHAGLCGGQLDAAACLNMLTRELRASGSFDFDVHEISPLLTTNSQRWLRQFAWQTPPAVSGEARLVLPVWTNTQPKWREEVMPTIELSGQFTGTEGAFRGIPISHARSHFALTNSTWYLPDLFVQRPGAQATLKYVGDMQTHDYHWGVEAAVEPNVLRPLFPGEAAQRVLDYFQFATPPLVQGEVWGRWHDPGSVGFDGQVLATNFTFRGELCSQLQGHAQLSDAFLTFSDVLIRHEAQAITVPAGSFDLTERVVRVTNAVSTMDPNLITKVIGPKVHAAIQPYQFQTPPTVRVDGCLPTFDIEDADAHFQVAGGSFRYWKLHATDIAGDVYWRGDSLSISNVHAGFYGGQLSWEGAFDFSVPVGSNIRFGGAVKNADFHALMADIGRKTNKLEGALDAQLTITSAGSDDWRSWEGFGRVQVRDGFLWDIPIFGFFSPVLNAIIPGLGHSRIKAGDATFHIDQSVVETRDLELKSPALRLRYAGSIDFKGKVDARMHAEILRDAWGVGRFVSWALWPLSKAFEYKITGTVDHPKNQPVYIPKALLWPLHPFRSVKRLFVSPKPPPPSDQAEESLLLTPEP